MNYLIANWKCNPTSRQEAKKILAGYQKHLKKNKKIQIAICPPAHLLDLVKNTLKNSVMLGAQDCFWQNGAFTGAISASQLADAGCRYVIIGHSERREFFGETNEIINKKIKAALATGLTPIICIGETRAQRLQGKLIEVINTQIREACQDIDLYQQPLFIAYEPIWAIGSGQACPPAEAAVVSQYLNNILNGKISLLYGGSVNPNNGLSYLQEAGYHGLLVSSISLRPTEFCALAANISII